jgi:hypothetical protein
LPQAATSEAHRLRSALGILILVTVVALLSLKAMF